MQYCALDVKATHEVFTEQLPLFMERSVNPQTQICFSHLLLRVHGCIQDDVSAVSYKVPSSSDARRDAGDGCELPPRQSTLGAIPGRFSGHLRRAPERNEEVSDDSSR